VLAAAAVLVAAWFWPRETVVPPQPAPAPVGPPALSPRVLQPDAVRFGQIAGKMAELRFRIERAGRACDTAPLVAGADRFAAARADADHADPAALLGVLDTAAAAVEACGESAGALYLLRAQLAPGTPPR
jgi:hypothetical protein